jgi:hypothetical protein
LEGCRCSSQTQSSTAAQVSRGSPGVGLWGTTQHTCVILHRQTVVVCLSAVHTLRPALLCMHRVACCGRWGLLDGGWRCDSCQGVCW